MPRVYISALIVAIFACAGFQFSVHQSFVNPYEKICDLVEQRIYLSKAETAEWIDRCRKRAELVRPFTPTARVVRDARNLLSQLEVSHLEIYHPQEVARLWNGWNVETGVESEFVDGELVVFRVHENSPGEEAGIKPGDLILKIQGTLPAPALVRSVGGEIEAQRQTQKFTVTLTPREITLDERPSFERMNDSTVVLKIPSFRAEFFEEKVWTPFVEQIPRVPHLVVDLRGNVGGNFVSGLRFLSPFMCEEQEIGFLLKPRLQMVSERAMPNDLRDETQIQILEDNELVRLRTPVSPRCFTSRVTVLIDSQTASTSEMVTQALRDYLDARVMGVSSAGQLLVGVWHTFPALGPGWRISVPEAVYQSRRGKRLEAEGVRVDRELYYDLSELMAGDDSWVLRAMTDFRREPAAQDSRKTVSK